MKIESQEQEQITHSELESLRKDVMSMKVDEK